MLEQTIDGRCKELGLEVYDTAVPQPWADSFREVTGLYPPGHFVWCYDRCRTWGEPVPLTWEAVDAMIQESVSREEVSCE